MKVDTDMPALQFYTAGGLKDGTPGKNGAVYGRFSGMCFETQFCPDSPNRPEFPSCVLREGEEYRHTTVFSFEAKH
jgi:aldose 1-epimerase